MNKRIIRIFLCDIEDWWWFGGYNVENVAFYRENLFGLNFLEFWEFNVEDVAL